MEDQLDQVYILRFQLRKEIAQKPQEHGQESQFVYETDQAEISRLGYIKQKFIEGEGRFFTVRAGHWPC